MAVTKSNFVAVIAGTEYKLDCAPFPRTEGKLQANLLVNGTSVKSAVSRSKTEVYYTYFLWEGKSYSFQRGILITPAEGEITLNPVAGKPAPKTLREELAEAGVSVEEAMKAAKLLEKVATPAPALDTTNEVLMHIAKALETPKAANKARTPKK